MSKWLIIGAVALLLLSAGCMQKSKGQATTSPAGSKALPGSVQQQQTAKEALPDIGTMPPTGAQPYRANAEDKQKVRELVLQLAPAYDLTYMTGTDKLAGLGLAEGVELGKLVEIMSGKLLKGPNKTDMPNYEQVVRGVLAQLQALGKNPQNKLAAADVEKGLKATPSGQAPPEPLRPAKIAVGEWKSVREVRDDKPQLVVEHNDKYYTNMFIMYEGKAIFQLFRDGKIFSNTEYPWKYNPSTGELQLLGPNNKIIETLTILEKVSEPDQIYVKQAGKMSTTVYRKTGRGNLPITPEERERMKQMMSGSSKPPSNGPNPGK